MGDIGNDPREVEFEPFPATEPTKEPTPIKQPTPEPVREPEKVPA